MMSHQFTISDDTYATIATLAKERGKSPEELAVQLLQQQVDAEWEAACSRYDTITTSPEWQRMEAEAESELTAGSGEYYANDDAFIRAFEKHQ
jgi:hypothetical protein